LIYFSICLSYLVCDSSQSPPFPHSLIQPPSSSA
jgi:hypothetical protein